MNAAERLRGSGRRRGGTPAGLPIRAVRGSRRRSSGSVRFGRERLAVPEPREEVDGEPAPVSSFDRTSRTLSRARRPDGGPPDEPLRTLDAMLPGRFPHTPLRLRDPRGLGETYEE
jgi:hypothetical protein